MTYRTSVRLLVVVACTISAAFIQTLPASASGILPPHHPAASIAESGRQDRACLGGAAQGQPYCDRFTLADINDARALEGVKAMVLPTNYYSLTLRQQVFVVSNLERVDRGLPPVAGLSSGLDAKANQGAAAYQDPVPGGGFGMTGFASNIAVGLNSALNSDYAWMYFDGPGSTNSDCTPYFTNGCWGHRDNILEDWRHWTSQPISMGVGVYQPTSSFVGASNSAITQLWISSPAIPLYFTWAQEKPFLIGSTGATAGYWMLGVRGHVYAFGNAPAGGSALMTNGVNAMHIEPSGSHKGYWVINGRGNVYTFGGANYAGGTPALLPSEFVTSMSTTATGNGYWIFTTLGRALPYGDAKFYGDMRATHLNGPVIASVATPTGHGYYMVGSDGGIFTFGDARFHGSLGGRRLNRPIVGIAPTPDNRGYWLVGADGGVFAFRAPFRGSTGGIHLNQSVTGLVAYGNGYLMVASDGGVFDFSNRAFVGSLGGGPPLSPVVAIAPFKKH